MHAGEGEFGIVHKALFHGTLVAAKILKGSSAIALGDFRQELEVLRKVHHPNAVQFIGACTKQEPYILVTGVAPRNGFLLQVFSFPFTSSWLFQEKAAKANTLRIRVSLSHEHTAVGTSIDVWWNLHIEVVEEIVIEMRLIVYIWHGAELMAGGSLADAMRMSRPFTLRRAMELAVDTARGLAYLHAKREGAIIHRWNSPMPALT